MAMMLQKKPEVAPRPSKSKREYSIMFELPMATPRADSGAPPSPTSTPSSASSGSGATGPSSAGSGGLASILAGVKVPPPQSCPTSTPTPFSPPKAAPAGAQPIVSSIIKPWQGKESVTGGKPKLGPDEFGITVCDPKNSAFGIFAAKGGWEADGLVNAEFFINVRNKLGPHGQKNVTGPNDKAITVANFDEVGNDLLPWSNNCGGRPARTHWWSKSLTQKHEDFHLDEQIEFAKQATNRINTWLTSQSTTGSADFGDRLLPAAMSLWLNDFQTNMATPASEQRAYADGAPDYRKLVFDIIERF